jgi:DNA-binding SARP family transcriptional activator
MFRLRLFGGASLEGDSAPLKGRSVQPRRIALLSLLASDRHHTVSREKITAYLWPESDAKRGRHRLSESRYVLRKYLGEGTLVSEGESIRLNPGPFLCDVISFSGALEKRDTEAAVALYAGPFMDGFFLKNAPEFDRWIEAERWKLADDYRRALEALATAADENGDHVRAVEWWSLLASHDPYNSRFALGCMQAMARAGDPGNAIYMAGEHARFLQKELGTEPTTELRTFAESLRNGVVHPQVDGGKNGEASD